MANNQDTIQELAGPASPAVPILADNHQAPESLCVSSDTVLWVRAVDWLRRNKRLKGARMLLAMMDLWATTVNVYENLFGVNHADALSYSADSGYPLVEAELEMADSKTIAQCLKRASQLADAAKLGQMTPAEEDERAAISRYLRQVSFQGRPRVFVLSRVKARKTELEALRYLLQKLDREDPGLHAYVKAHLQTRRTFRWI